MVDLDGRVAKIPSMGAVIELIAEPIDDCRCRFVLSRPLHQGGAARFRTVDEAAGMPVAEAVLSVPGVTEVVMSGNVMTVSKDVSSSWEEIGEQVSYAVNTAAAAEEMARAREAFGGGEELDDDAMYDTVDQLLRTEINPAVAQHGGKVELIDVQDATVVVRMRGGCQGCGMATVTLRQGIEAGLKQVIPTLKGISDITDHSAGTNPYFSAATK